MQVENELIPSDPKQIEEFMQEGPKGPIFMINMLKFRDKAEYEDGRETDLTGREAYGLYGAAVFPLLERFGGAVVFAADTTFLQIGKVDELWDEVLIAAYPNRQALFDMIASTEWQEASVHRAAGLKGQLNIESVLLPGFAESGLFDNVLKPAKD